MSYDARLRSNAEEEFKSLDWELRTVLSEAIEALCEDPMGLGRKAGFPYPPNGQMYVPPLIARGDDLIEVVVGYHFAPGEAVIVIDWIKANRIH